MFDKISHNFFLDSNSNLEISLQTGHLARLSDSSVVLSIGDLKILACVVCEKNIKSDVDFFPLTVEYRENYSAIGKIPGGFVKREGKPSDREILISRLVDRSIRPLFPSWYRQAIQINISLLSFDLNINPDQFAVLAASSALMICPFVPFFDPVSQSRVVKYENKIFATLERNNLEFDLDIIVAGNENSILMVEGESKQISEEELLYAIEIGQKEIKKKCKNQRDFYEKFLEKKNQKKNLDEIFDLYKHKEGVEIDSFILDKLYQDISDKYFFFEKSKKKRKENFDLIKDNFFEIIKEKYEGKYVDNIYQFQEIYSKIKKKSIRDSLLKSKKRLDGRDLSEIRDICIETNFLPSTHGSCLFTRGETQALATITLGNKTDEQILDGISDNNSCKFMLHYNFPGFSTGEIKPSKSISRREIGHGNLAMRSLKNIIPGENPYTIRIVSDILESNGSSSMASVCAGSLALMDCGIKISENVAGVAMGLLFYDKENYLILSDISGEEDALGDMDFKVAGTKNGITAIQMDIKIQGISFDILRKSLEEAKKSRIYILDKMNNVLSKPREEMKSNVPKFLSFKIKKNYIKTIIGSGGKTIQEIQKKSCSNISIEEIDDSGVLSICSSNSENLKIAEKLIRDLIAEPEINSVYKGKVKSVLDFGAFIEFLPNKEGLLHVSEFHHGPRIENFSEFIKEGDEIEVKLIDIDKKTGKFRLSKKVLIENELK
jgi:polyribonucleotide nucleotidyltransferase